MLDEVIALNVPTESFVDSKHPAQFQHKIFPSVSNFSKDSFEHQGPNGLIRDRLHFKVSIVQTKSEVHCLTHDTLEAGDTGVKIFYDNLD